MREAKGKGEVSDLERKWGKPPHLFVLSELVPMAPVVISRCWVTVFFFLNLTTAAGKGRERHGLARRPRTVFATEQLGRGGVRPPRPAQAPPTTPAGSGVGIRRPHGGVGFRKHGSAGICIWAGAAFNRAGRRKCR